MKTAHGDRDYIQIMSDDYVTTNVVLIADEIEVRDERPKPKKPSKSKEPR
jgi:hypothetical protein